MSSAPQQFCNEDSCTSFDSEEIFSSSSYDRSSIGSIPWAEDSIKQNQQEWERIERMFYGEEELPQETDLRNEILDWRRAFPHLRINGTKLKISKVDCKTSVLKDFEEIFISHPQNKVFSIKTNADTHFEQNESRKKATKDRIVEELEKNLRISSVPIVSRSRTLNKQPESTLVIHAVGKDSKYKDLKKSSSRRVESIFFPIYKSSNNEEISSNSATIFRMPPIINVIDPERNYLTHPPIKKTFSGKSAIVLPKIDSCKIPSEKNFRSISAAASQRMASNYSLFNTLKFGGSK